MSITSLAVSASFAIAAMFFGASRDLGMFLLGIPVLGSLLILSLICLGIVISTDKSSRSVTVSSVLVLLAPIAAFAAGRLRDPVRFAGWAITHQAVLKTAGLKDSIITEWSSWSIASSSKSSYLISDKFDNSSSAVTVQKWRSRMGLDCPIATTVRMQKGIYIVTIYNCPSMRRLSQRLLH